MKYPITILITCLVGCLPLEPDVTGIFVTYNFCLHPIEVKNTELSDNYENKKISTIDVNTQKIAKSFSSEKPIVQAKKIYFLENRVKKNFKIDIYRERRVNLIACPENAKPTGDSNWIKLTIRKLEKFKEREIFHKTAEKSTALFVFSGHALGDDCHQGVITRYRKPLC